MLEIIAVIGMMAIIIAGSTDTALGMFGLIRHLQAETVYSQDLLPASRNMNKLIARAQSYQIFENDAAAVNNDSGRVAPIGTAARLVFPNGSVAILSFVNNSIVFKNISPNRNEFVVLSGVDEATFSLYDPDPERPSVSGLMVITLTRANRSLKFYVEPL
jgi:type II secretory pathway pseudopilin PulG